MIDKRVACNRTIDLQHAAVDIRVTGVRVSSCKVEPAGAAGRALPRDLVRVLGFQRAGKTVGQVLDWWATSDRRLRFRDLLFERDGNLIAQPFDPVSAGGEYLGGIIMPGVEIDCRNQRRFVLPSEQERLRTPVAMRMVPPPLARTMVRRDTHELG